MSEVPQKHLFDGTELNVYETGNVVNLSAGAPGPDLLRECSNLFLKATEHRMKHEFENNAYLFQYGPAIGRIDFRTVLADFLSRRYHANVNPVNLVVTTGATQGLHLILSTLLDLHAFVFVDEVTYMIALEAISQFNTMKIVAVPFSTRHGVDLDALEQLVTERKFTPSNDKPFWGVYYTIPTFHNPTGVLYSEATCKKLIKIARDNNLLVACDDVYNVLSYDTETPPKRLFAFDDVKDENYRGNVISNGTFSKILSPGIRLGWMECPVKIADIFRESGVLRSGGCANGYMTGIVQSLIELKLLDGHLDLYYAKYKERMEAACEILKKKLDPSCDFQAPRGGYFIWITFPEGTNCLEFNEFCRKNFGVVAIPGPRFSAQGLFKNCMRLTIAFHEVATIKLAITKFCEAFDAYKKIKN
ncbi:uncharacterized protein LOC134831656 [Culicoides brevitarsis]|uniref:uncharacterized protein LOC134831656 n=1 Tax=Culicoides brevitarsis TaxID=469753 RepID=UPI00307C0EF4